MIIGLCGGSGSGKTTVLELLRSYNIFPINTDEIYRNITNGPSDCLDALRNEFGDDIIVGGALDRRALAKTVFSDKGRLKRLNEITHFFILNVTRAEATKALQNGALAAVVDAPALFESGFDKECDIVLAVISDVKERTKRIITRDNITETEAILRISAQLSDDFLIANADYVIKNDGSFDELKESVDNFVKTIKK